MGLTFLLWLSFYVAQSQITQSDTGEINRYIRTVESFKNCKVKISEGTRLRRHWYQNSKGGFGVYTYRDSLNNLYKMSYHDNFNKNTYLTFYYAQNKLLSGMVRYEENGQGDTIYHFEYYFSDDSLIAKTGKIKKKYKKPIIDEVEIVGRAKELKNDFGLNE